MDPNQQAAIRQCMSQLIESVDVGAVGLHLRARNIITGNDIERIQSTITSKESRMKLLEIIQYRDGAWDAFIQALREAKQSYLADMLLQMLEQLASGHQPQKKSTQQDAQSILQEFDATIRLAARRRALEIEQENVISILDAKEAIEEAKTQGISGSQYHDIKNEPNQKRAAQALYEILQRIESGYSILISYMKNKGKYTETANDLEYVCNDQIAKLKRRIQEFIENDQIDEPDREKRNQLIRILRRKFDVAVDGTYIKKQ